MTRWNSMSREEAKRLGLEGMWELTQMEKKETDGSNSIKEDNLKEFIMNILAGTFGFIGGFLLLSAVVHLIEFTVTTPIASGVVLGLILLWAIYNVGRAIRGKD